MKKVFSKAKWMERNLSLRMKEEFLLDLTWPDECEGLTEEEMIYKGFLTSHNWMVEVDDEIL